MLLHALSAWQSISRLAHPSGGESGCKGVCSRGAAGSGQRTAVWRGAGKAGAPTNPYEVVKAGIGNGRSGKRMSARDVLLVVQIAICAVLVTSSLVAVRGLVRSLHNHFGFDIENTMVASTDLSMSGYSGDRVPAMQKRMIEAIEVHARRGVRGIDRHAAR